MKRIKVSVLLVSTVSPFPPGSLLPMKAKAKEVVAKHKGGLRKNPLLRLLISVFHSIFAKLVGLC
jgi:pyruvate/2-oxoacid:ferredoxin oxidoreductase alpha subunit